MLSRCVDWNFIQAKQALARGTLRKTLSLSWNVCKLVLVMDLEPLISHQFHYCVQRTSTYFNVFQRDHGQDGRLQAASRPPGSKSKAHLSDTPKHLSFQVFKSPKNRLRLFDLTACTVARCCHDELWDSQTAATRPPRRRAIPPVADELASSPSSVSSVNVPQHIPPMQNMFETHQITTAHSDLDAFKTFWWCNVIRYGRCVLILRFHKLKDVHHSSESDGDENEAPKSSSIHVSCSHAESSQSIFIYESNLDWTNQDEFSIYIYRVPLERPAQSGWPSQGRIHWISWISLSVWSEDEWSMCEVWVEVLEATEYLKYKSITGQPNALLRRVQSYLTSHCHITTWKHGVVENRIMISGFRMQRNWNC